MLDDEPTVLILGCGPAGMFAAHAVAQAGYSFAIVSKNRKSYMRGAQYLHQPIPGLSGEPFEVTYDLWGSVDGYRDKVYGDMGDILVSPETLTGTSPAWDIREAYDAAWDLYSGRILNADLGQGGHLPNWVRDVAQGVSLAISTIPAPILCGGGHEFRSTSVWATEGLKRPKEMGFHDHDGKTLRDNLVVCSGDPDDWWYRQSRIHGWENTEFPHNHKPAGGEFKVHEVIKPLSTNCDCHPEFHRQGRYGRWQKGVLSHEAYYDTVRQLVAVEQGDAEAVAL